MPIVPGRRITAPQLFQAEILFAAHQEKASTDRAGVGAGANWSHYEAQISFTAIKAGQGEGDQIRQAQEDDWEGKGWTW